MKTPLSIGRIPAIVWGPPSDKAYIYVHGKLSSKEAAEEFAALAAQKGWQTVSFDLPCHGERSDRDGCHGERSEHGSCHGERSEHGSCHGERSDRDGCHGERSEHGSCHGERSEPDGCHGERSEPDGWHGKRSEPDGCHGERSGEPERCDIWNGMRDLSAVADMVFARWRQVALFACSLGAYFSLLTYAERRFENCLFQSPIVDMDGLIESMMRQAGVSAARLEAEGEIETPIELLSWRYREYVKAHPVTRWDAPTSILYAAGDVLQPRAAIEAFAAAHSCRLTVAPDSEHPFMAPGDAAIVRAWMQASL